MTIVILLSLHLFLLPFIINSIQFLFGSKDLIVFSKIEILLFALLAGIIQYYFFIYQRKWESYIKEFEHVNKMQKRLDLIYLFICLPV